MTDEQPSFADVAATLAKGRAPFRLVPGLQHFCDYYIRVALAKAGKPTAEGELERVMLKAAKLLYDWLPIYALEADAECPVEVEDAVTALSEVIDFLGGDVAGFDAIPPRGGGPRPDLRRPACAAVCAEAYRVVHGQIEPYSQHLQKACEEYWVACGNPPTGKSGDGFRRNWEEYLLLVRDQDNDWIADRFRAPQPTDPK